MISAANAMGAAGAVALAFSTAITADTIVQVTKRPMIQAEGSYHRAVAPGETILIPWRVSKAADCPGNAGRVWSGAQGFHLAEPLKPAAIPTTDSWRLFRIETTIPALAPEGPLQLRIVGTYTCPEGRFDFTLGPVVLTVRAPVEKES